MPDTALCSVKPRRTPSMMWSDAGRSFRRSNSRLLLALVRSCSRLFLFKPQTMVFPGPVEIDGAGAHRLKGTFHAYGTNIDVSDHGGDEQNGDDSMGDLGSLHVGNVCAIEGEHQHIATDRYRSAAENDDPVNHLLPGVEAVGRRVIMPDNAAAALQPFHIDPIGDIPCDPHDKNQEHSDREREAEIVMGIF